MGIYEFAMDFEMAGRNHYLKMVEETPSATGKQIFKILADEELRHYDLLKEMSQHSQVVVESGNMEVAEKVFNSLLGTDELQGYMLPIDYYTQGIILEEKSIAFYKEKAAAETDAAAKTVLQKIGFEEKKHKLLLENIRELMMESETRLASPELERPLKQDI